MIHSMTAFARGEKQGNSGTFVCEIRSINHRYLEVNLHLSEPLRGFEMQIRERIRKAVTRGKIECAIRYQSGVSTGTLFTVNTDLAKELCRASEQIAALLPNAAPVYPTDILRFPGVLETKEADVTTLEKETMELLDVTLAELVNVRAREGEELKLLFIQRMDLMNKELGSVRERLPQIQLDAKERLVKRFTEAKLDLDANRLEQEMLLFAQRMDVAEEIERAETHIAEVRRILKNGGSIGRRLDFLMQELNREANTLGSKSIDSTMTHAAVEMKVLIEQVREQVQNIE